VAALIERLDDSDPAVVDASCDALRKLTGRHDGDLGGPITRSNRQGIVNDWKTWYESVGLERFPAQTSGRPGT
jgi:hypothetical protein